MTGLDSPLADAYLLTCNAQIIYNFQQGAWTGGERLGTVLDSQLKFSESTDDTVQRANQRKHLLRKPNSFSISSNIFCSFCQTFT